MVLRIRGKKQNFNKVVNQSTKNIIVLKMIILMLGQPTRWKAYLLTINQTSWSQNLTKS